MTGTGKNISINVDSKKTLTESPACKTGRGRRMAI